MQKYIKEVFEDYKEQNNIVDAQIENINLYKKTNRLQINIASLKTINLTEIEDFENYLVNRFKVSKAIISVNYGETYIPQTLKEDWENIINYVAKKEQGAKAILRGSSLDIQNDEITVNLALKGANFLQTKKFDKGLEHLFENLYNKNYSVKFVEKLADNYDEIMEQRKQDEEKRILEEMRKQAEIELEIAKEEARKRKELEQQRKQEELEKRMAELPDIQQTAPEGKSPLIYGRNLSIEGNPIKIKDINNNSEKVCIDGEIIGDIDTREIKKEGKKDKVLTKFSVFDGTSTITCVGFFLSDKAEEILSRIKSAKGLRVDGIASYNDYDKEITVMANRIIETEGVEKEERMDNSEEKRVELHLHTQMSQMDAVTSATDLLKRAVKWGWKSIAITDHGVVQSFPEAHKFLQTTKADLKVLYGVEAYFVPDKDPCVSNYKEQLIDEAVYCVLDLETTGLSARTDKITEIGVIKYKNGEVVDEFEEEGSAEDEYSNV